MLDGYENRLNHRLARLIEAYWFERGFVIQVRAVNVPVSGESGVWAVRSNLVDGRPCGLSRVIGGVE